MKKLTLARFKRLGPLALGLAIPIVITGCYAPQTQSAINEPTINHDRNRLEIKADDTIHWNGALVSLADLPELLRQTNELEKEPELQFEPAPDASYDVSVQVLGAIRESGVAKFGFVGNEKYRVPETGSD
ncbi:biopolymer transporter ExbD [Erythrobacter sp. F6033]|uniref:ExbD/TolR family protein n=1 Tax=Erythrobacter sp. F6033 TaxID=2926401 RepID=UPI001FF29DF1|nr:biopolymer transporter ExbD [Erythrobacter sp. F6033]MCK0127035.1 biopolymer transporter ExbD [Erythrobacter sp. F6033]